MSTSTPLLPDADEARRWALEELSRSIYSDQPSFWELVWTRIWEILEKIVSAGSGLGPAFLPLVILALLAGLIILALTYRGAFHRRGPSPAAAGRVWEEGDERSAAVLRQAAAAAAADGDYSLAVVELFRAVVRSCSQRGILEVSEGTTATEVSQHLARLFPATGELPRQCAEAFNDVRYGSRTGSRSTYALIMELDQRTAQLPISAGASS